MQLQPVEKFQFQAPDSQIGRRTPLEDALKTPFNAVASDIDGVFLSHKDPGIAEKMIPMVVKETVAQGVDFAGITGKEEKDAFREIIEPFRRAAEAQGIELTPGKFMIYSNNGSVTIDAGMGKVIERKEFSYEDMDAIGRIETVQTLLEIYDLIEQFRNEITTASINEAETHFRQQDRSTICFRINPADLSRINAPLPIIRRIQKIAGVKNPTRFNIAEKMKAEFAEAGIEGVQISATDRSIDITPAGSGKRQALEDFSCRTGVPVENILRMGDSVTGMDFGLTAAQDDENRGGFSNVTIKEEEMKRLMALEENTGKRPPLEIGIDNNQFENVKWIFENATIEAEPPQSRRRDLFAMS